MWWEEGRTTWKARLALFAALLLLYIWPIDRHPGSNVYSHVDQAVSVVIDGTASIDRFIRSADPNTIDWARAPDGHFYPAKAPGAGLAAVPVFWAIYHLERVAGIDALAPTWFRRNAVLINWTLNALPSAFAILLLVELARSLGIAERPAIGGAVAVALGTAYYPYATVYYAHVPAANAAIVAAYFIFRPNPRPATDALAGLSAGLAVLFDYPAVFVVLALGAALLVLRPRAVAAYVAGGCLPLIVLLSYHTFVFGSPFTTAYSHQNPQFADPHGGFLGAPSWFVFGALTLSPYRGVFFFSPVLLLGLYGAATALRAGSLPDDVSQRRRVFAAVAVAVFGAWLLLNMSYRTWWGGFTTGPRFLVPAVALFAPLIAIGLSRFPRTGLLLAAISVMNYFAITAVWFKANDDLTNPLRQMIYPQFLQGRFARPNLGEFAGLAGAWSLLPPIVVATIAAWVIWRQPAMKE